MITFFTVPKPWRGHIMLIQDMALCNWKALPCDKQILTYETGGKTTAQGTPFLDDVFAKAAAEADYDVMMYSNADMLYMPSLVEAIKKVSVCFPKFLMVGQRTDVPSFILDFRKPDWDIYLKTKAQIRGTLHPPSGIDYFVFKRDMVSEIQMPSFAVGRPAWDNWMIARCLELGWPVVDATKGVLAVHQNHDFAHLRGGHHESRHGIEAQENRRLAGNKLKTIEDATHCLEDLS